jgi:hypothetical protein
VTSSDPTAGAGAWTAADIDGTNHLFTVSCPTSHFCAAGDDHGTILTAKNPTGGAAAWTAVTADPGHWILALSCPTATRCVAGDSAYDMVVGRRP